MKKKCSLIESDSTMSSTVTKSLCLQSASEGEISIDLASLPLAGRLMWWCNIKKTFVVNVIILFLEEQTKPHSTNISVPE